MIGFYIVFKTCSNIFTQYKNKRTNRNLPKEGKFNVLGLKLTGITNTGDINEYTWKLNKWFN